MKTQTQNRISVSSPPHSRCIVQRRRSSLHRPPSSFVLVGKPFLSQTAASIADPPPRVEQLGASRPPSVVAQLSTVLPTISLHSRHGWPRLCLRGTALHGHLLLLTRRCTPPLSVQCVFVWIISNKDSPRGTHFRRAGPRQKVYFASDDVQAAIVTCGGLCPGLNTVIRELVCGLYHMYGVKKILGINGGYKGFYAHNTISLSPKSVNDIHKRGGTILGSSRGGHDTSKIVDSIQDRGINQVYIIGGDGTQRGASSIFEEIRKRGLKVAVVGIPKTIDNDIPVIDKSFGFDTAVEEAQRAINAAHVEAESVENGIGVVKLMGRYSGFIAMYATLASRDVDCCLIPETPFFLEGPGGLFEFTERRLKENGHMVIVIAEGAGQELVSESIQSMHKQDASGNKLLQDVGLWISQKMKDHFAKTKTLSITLKYIDPTYMIRAVPSNASDNVYCTLLAQSAVHGAMAGYTGFTSGLVNGRQTYIPFYRITEGQNKVVITDRMWARLLSSTNQPSFLIAKTVVEDKKEEEAFKQP